MFVPGKCRCFDQDLWYSGCSLGSVWAGHFYASHRPCARMGRLIYTARYRIDGHPLSPHYDGHPGGDGTWPHSGGHHRSSGSGAPEHPSWSRHEQHDANDKAKIQGGFVRRVMKGEGASHGEWWSHSEHPTPTRNSNDHHPNHSLTISQTGSQDPDNHIHFPCEVYAPLLLDFNRVGSMVAVTLSLDLLSLTLCA
jgi:hypothetical protein